MEKIATTFIERVSDTKVVLPNLRVHGLCVLDNQLASPTEILQNTAWSTGGIEASKAKPKIALVMSRLTDVLPNGETTGYFIPQNYVSAIEQSGGEVMLVDYDTNAEDVAKNCNGLLVIGGNSAFPQEWYAEGEESPYSTAKDSIDSTSRGRAEAGLMDTFHAKNKPILGICNGMQTLAAHFGGAKLTGNIHNHNSNEINHCSPDTRHDVLIEQKTKLARITGAETMVVNSFHNEAVIEIPKGSHIQVSAKAPDGAIEAVELKGYPFAVGVQFHPESLALHHGSDPAQKIISAFINESATNITTPKL